MSRQFATSSSRAASSSGTAWTSSMASRWTKPSRRSTNSNRSTSLGPLLAVASQDFSERETAVVLDAGEGILIKHGRASLRGLLKGKIDSKGFEADVRKLRKEWTL